MARNPLRVLVVDDHPMVRDVIRLAVEERPGLRFVGEAGDGEAALARVQELDPDVVVLDLTLPKLDGLEVARRIRTAAPRTRILAISGRDDEDVLLECVRAGVDGFLEKTHPVERIAAAIEAVGGGTPTFSPEHDRRVRAHLRSLAVRARTAHRATNRLSPRERQVLSMLSEGMTTRAIASTLGVSPRTVEGHVGRLYEKLEVRTRVQAVHRAAALGLVRLG